MRKASQKRAQISKPKKQRGVGLPENSVRPRKSPKIAPEAAQGLAAHKLTLPAQAETWRSSSIRTCSAAGIALAMIGGLAVQGAVLVRAASDPLFAPLYETPPNAQWCERPVSVQTAASPVLVNGNQSAGRTFHRRSVTLMRAPVSNSNGSRSQPRSPRVRRLALLTLPQPAANASISDLEIQPLAAVLPLPVPTRSSPPLKLRLRHLALLTTPGSEPVNLHDTVPDLLLGVFTPPEIVPETRGQLPFDFETGSEEIHSAESSKSMRYASLLPLYPGVHKSKVPQLDAGFNPRVLAMFQRVAFPLPKPVPSEKLHFRGGLDTGCLPKELIRVLADVAARFGDIEVISTHRNPLLNARVGGAPRSMHLECRAIDFILEGDGRKAIEYIKKRPEVGGYKRYPSGSFHIDNGPRRSW